MPSRQGRSCRSGLITEISSNSTKGCLSSRRATKKEQGRTIVKPNLTDPGKVIITVATTGGLHGREANPNLPEQPRDIIRNFRECYDAGASVAHIHVRDKRGVTTSDLSVYCEVVDGSMSKCPALITHVANRRWL